LGDSLQKAAALPAPGDRNGGSAAPQGTRVGNESSELALLLLLGHDTPPWVITLTILRFVCSTLFAYSLPNGRAKIVARSVAENVQTPSFALGSVLLYNRPREGCKHVSSEVVFAWSTKN
jgi:hypothetical protein